MLDEALRIVPEKYRLPILLCYLEGKTQEEAARQLGCPLGTLRSRLARGRECLKAVLERQGVHLSAARWPLGWRAVRLRRPSRRCWFMRQRGLRWRMQRVKLPQRSSPHGRRLW